MANLKDSTFKKYCLVVDEWLVNGFNGVKAYQKYYPKATLSTADANFRKILEFTRIQEYRDNKQRGMSQDLQITLERQVKELEELKDKAKDTDKINEAINALKEQSKLLGLYEADNAQKKPIFANFVISSLYGDDKQDS